MKTVIVNGSPRKNGRTAALLALMKRELSEAGPVEWFDAYDLNVKPCMGCMRCRPDGHCALPYDDAHRVRAAIESADAFVVGTPMYWNNMTAPLKAIFDRNVTLFESFAAGWPAPKLRGRRAAIVVSAGSPWPFSRLAALGGSPMKLLTTILHAGGGMKIVGRILISGAGSGAPLDARVSRKAIAVSKRLMSK
jgi:multimeric flavodoxin WrbA